jgi:dTDP-4-amino-4,6-dideoxygalactose transaminase
VAESKNSKLIRLSKSCVGNQEKSAVAGVLDREYLGMGAEVGEFEKALSSFFGRPVACVVNGTAALQLAIQACGIGPGDEVLVPSLTYVASFQAIKATGATPVACDIDPSNGILDHRDAERRVTSRTKAVMPVHYTGGVGDLDAIAGFARAKGLRVIEDAAHAFGTTHHQKKIGSFGDIACFSFDGIKNITSGEGGCIVTEDRKVIEEIQDLRLLGVEKDTAMRLSGQRSWEFDVVAQGWRYHMSNIMAAIGIEQLKRFPQFSEKRQTLAKRYDLEFENHPRIRTIKHDYSKVVPHIYVVRMNGLKDRKALQKKLLEQGIQTGIHYQPNHTLTYFKPTEGPGFPHLDQFFPEILTLPLHPDLSPEDVEYVASRLKSEIGGFV